MNRRLPLHPTPRNGESLGFYLVRLASCMGYSSATQLLSETGLGGKRLLAPDNWRLMEHIVNITGHSDRLFKDACFGSSLAYAIDNSNRHYTRLALKDPHVCPSCMAHRPVVKSHWQYLPHTHCENHGQKLLSACPACGESFKWDIGLLSTGCAHCGTQWPGMVEADSAVPAYQVAFRNAAEQEKARLFVQDLMTAAKKALRPFDLIIDQSPITYTVDDWAPVLDRAFKMLSDREFITAWHAQCHENLEGLRLFGKQAANEPINSLASNVSGEWEVCSYDRQLIQEQAGVPIESFSNIVTKSRIACESDPDIDHRLCMQADLQTAARLLGAAPSDVTTLWEQGALKSVNSPRQQRYAFFDMQQFVANLAGRSESCAKGLIQFSTMRHVLPLFDARFGELLVAVANGAIPFHIDTKQETLAQGLSVSPIALYRALSRQLKQDPEKQYPRYRLTSLVGMSKHDLDDMTRAGVIQATPAHGEGVFTKQRIVALTEKYFYAIRWAKLRRKSPAQVRKQLREAGIAPIYGRNVYTRASAKAALRTNASQLSHDSK